MAVLQTMAHTNHFRYVLRQRRLALKLPTKKLRELSSKTHRYQTGGNGSRRHHLAALETRP